MTKIDQRLSCKRQTHIQNFTTYVNKNTDYLNKLYSARKRLCLYNKRATSKASTLHIHIAMAACFYVNSVHVRQQWPCATCLAWRPRATFQALRFTLYITSCQRLTVLLFESCTIGIYWHKNVQNSDNGMSLYQNIFKCTYNFLFYCWVNSCHIFFAPFTNAPIFQCLCHNLLGSLARNGKM